MPSRATSAVPFLQKRKLGISRLRTYHLRPLHCYASRQYAKKQPQNHAPSKYLRSDAPHFHIGSAVTLPPIAFERHYSGIFLLTTRSDLLHLPPYMARRMGMCGRSFYPSKHAEVV
jgi:hypothetical protein